MAIENVNSFMNNIETNGQQLILRPCGTHGYKQATQSLSEALIFLFGRER